MAEAPPPPPPQPSNLSNSLPEFPPQQQTPMPLNRFPSSQPHPPPLPPPEIKPFSLFPLRRPPIRLTTKYDSENRLFFHKASSRFLDGFAKLKISFLSSTEGQIFNREVSLVTDNLSLRYDVEDNDAEVRLSLDAGPNFKLTAAHHLQAQRSEVGLIANLLDPAYKLQLASSIPLSGLPKATFSAPFGEVSLEEEEDEEERRTLSVNGRAKGSLMNGLLTAKYDNEILNLSYSYKDEEMAFIPNISLPLKASEPYEQKNYILGFAFRRRFGPSSKLSYWYDFDSNNWSTVYKHKIGPDLKFKVGYDSKERVGSAALWVGDCNGKAKSSPMKTNIQVMVRVPQDDVKSRDAVFWIKKRWDI